MTLSRPALIYLVMIVVLVVGLWIVLAIGARLSASEDLAGKWELHSTLNTAETKMLTIEQSGEFFQISFEPGKLIDLKLRQQSDAKLLLANGQSQLEVTGKKDSDDKIFVLTGPQSGNWSAHRTVRTFPEDVSAREGK